MTHEELVRLVRKHGVNGKLRRAIEQAMGWRRDDFRTGQLGGWYTNWHWFAPQLNAAVRDAYA